MNGQINRCSLLFVFGPYEEFIVMFVGSFVAIPYLDRNFAARAWSRYWEYLNSYHFQLLETIAVVIVNDEIKTNEIENGITTRKMVCVCVVPRLVECRVYWNVNEFVCDCPYNLWTVFIVYFWLCDGLFFCIMLGCVTTSRSMLAICIFLHI